MLEYFMYQEQRSQRKNIRMETEIMWTAESHWSGFHDMKTGTVVSAAQRIEHWVVTHCKISSVSLFLEQTDLGGSQVTSYSMSILYLGNVINLFVHVCSLHICSHKYIYYYTSLKSLWSISLFYTWIDFSSRVLFFFKLILYT